MVRNFSQKNVQIKDILPPGILQSLSDLEDKALQKEKFYSSSNFAVVYGGLITDNIQICFTWLHFFERKKKR